MSLVLSLILATAQSSDGAPSAGAADPTHIGAPAGTLTGLPRPTDLVFDAEGGLFVLTAADHAVRRFAPAEGGLLAPGGAATALPGEGGRPSGLAWLSSGAPDGSSGTLVWCGAERQLVALGLGADARVLATARRAPDDGVPAEVTNPEGVAASADGRLVAVADTGARRVVVLTVDGSAPPLVITGERFVRPIDVGFLPASTALPAGGLAVLDADTSRVELFDLTGAWRGGFGDWGYFPGLFAAPQGLATWRDEIFVADTDNHRVQVFAPKTGAALEYELRYAWGVHAIRPGEGDGSLHYPTDVAVAPDGSFAAVCEPLDGRVQLFRRAPGAEPPIDPLRVGIGQASAHYGRVADIDGQFMAVAEPESRRVVLFDLRLDEPVEIGGLGGHGQRLGMLMRPTGLALDAARRELLVADGALRRLARVSLAIDPAEPLRFYAARERWLEAVEFGRLGGGVLGAGTQPIEPLEVDSLTAADGGFGGAVLVDGANGRVLELGPDLLPVRVLLGPEDGLVAPLDVTLDRDGSHVWVADAGGGALFRVARADRAVQRIALRAPARPMNVSVAPDGRVLASDVATHRIRIVATRDGALAEVTPIGVAPEPVNADNRAAAWLTNRGLAPLWFCEPADLGVDGRGRLLVIDHGNHRGVILDEAGAVLLGFGSRLYTEPLNPRGRR